MIRKISAVCLALFLIQVSAFAQNNVQVMNVVEITKIDLKKMTLSVKSDLADGASLSGRGLPAGGRGGRGGSAGGGGVHTRQFKVYVTKETAVKDGGKAISFDSLKVGDHIAVTGTPKGSDIEATQIAKSSHSC